MRISDWSSDVCSSDLSKVLASASTTQTDVRDGLKSNKNIEAAAKVGRAIAEKARAAGVEKVAFDRSGYRYHSRGKPLADAARAAGLQFCCLNAWGVVPMHCCLLAARVAPAGVAGSRHAGAPDPCPNNRAD